MQTQLHLRTSRYQGTILTRSQCSLHHATFLSIVQSTYNSCRSDQVCSCRSSLSDISHAFASVWLVNLLTTILSILTLVFNTNGLVIMKIDCRELLLFTNHTHSHTEQSNFQFTCIIRRNVFLLD